MNIDKGQDTAFADLFAPKADRHADTGLARPVAWIAISDVTLVRTVAHALVRLGWHVGLATTRLHQLIDATGDPAQQHQPPQLILSGIRFVDGDAFHLVRRLSEWTDSPALLLITQQQRAVIRAAMALARQVGLRTVDCCELPLAAEHIAWRAQALARQDCHRAAPPAVRPPLARQDLERLIAEGRVVPYLQPKMRIDTREIVGFEALMRGIDIDGGQIGPDRLIDPLVSNGLLDAATLQMARHTFGFVADCLMAGQPTGASLNVSLSLMSDRRFCADLLDLVERSGVDPSWITLEITESEAMSDPAGVIEQAGRIRMYGFNLSIDDFGTAYSSFFQLSQIPFSELKIERAFVSDIGNDRTRRAIVAACAQLGRALDLSVVAEGVETQDDLACVAELGCTVAQGYLLSRPMQATDALRWLAAHGLGASAPNRPDIALV